MKPQMGQLPYAKIDPVAVSIVQANSASKHFFRTNIFRIKIAFSVIITQTVGQMTDDKLSTTIATQTPLPQTHLSFSSLTGSAVVHPQHSNRQQSSNSKFSPFEQKILENELLLQTQRNALKNIDRILNDEQFIDKCANRKIAEHLNDEQQKRSTSLKQSTNLTQSKTMRMVNNK